MVAMGKPPEQPRSADERHAMATQRRQLGGIAQRAVHRRSMIQLTGGEQRAQNHDGQEATPGAGPAVSRLTRDQRQGRKTPA